MTLPDLEQQLREHASCVRSLAVALLRDDAAADDVVQETLLAVSRQAPAEARSLRAWMLRVGRRLASRWRRSNARRSRREQAAATPEQRPSAADEAARAEQLQVIAAAVAALSPSLRDVVLLRHYDGRRPREIAARLSLTVEAVESRLRRAHDQLRVALRRHAPDGDVRRALLLFVAPGAWPTTLPGVAVVSTKSKSLFAVVALVLLLAGALFLFRSPVADEGPQHAALASASLPAAREARAESAERTEVAAAPAPDGATFDERPSWTAHVTGRVVDERRYPVAGVPVVAEVRDGARAESISDAAGRFALALPVSRQWGCEGRVRAARDHLADEVVFGASFESTNSDAGVLVLLPTGRLVVQVRDGSKPIAGATATAARAAFTPGIRDSATTRDDGDATLRRLPPARYVVGATAADGRWAVGVADVVGGRDVGLALDLAATTPVPVAVRARDDRAPIAGAQVEAMLEAEAESLAKVPLRLVVPLPVTDDKGQATLTGLRRDQRVGVGASHAAWRPMVMFNAPPLDWRAATPRAEVLLASFDTIVWQLVDGDVPVPPDGTVFRVLETRVRLRDGRLHFDGQPLVDVRPAPPIIAIGPGCHAELHLPERVAGAKTKPAPLRRSRQLVVDLRDNAGYPLPDWKVQIAYVNANAPWTCVRTDARGRALAEDLLAKQVNVTIDERQSTGMKELGTVDLTRADGALTVALGPPRRVRANVWVDGRRGLPGRMNLRCLYGHITGIEEDVEAGVVAFDVWTLTPGERLQLSIDPTQGLGVAHLVVEAGMEPAEVQFRLERNGSATINLVLPADECSQVRVERFHVQENGGFWAFAATARGPTPPRLWSLQPGRYRLRDDLSNVTGPEVEVTANAPDAQLILDLSRVVSACGRVAANPPFDGIRIEVRDRNGAVLQKKDVYAHGDGYFDVRAIVEPGTVLVAVRGDASSAPVPWTGTMHDLVLVLPQQ